jgi:transcriptional regulator PpsR
VTDKNNNRLGSSLGALDAGIAARVVAAAADVALVLDAGGVIRDVAYGEDARAGDDYHDWIGQPWIETVTVESRPKVEQLLRDAEAGARVRWREINHALSQGNDLPVRYSAIRVQDDGRVLAIGRDLRAVVSLQQRLLDVQRAMEREYARLRNAETRYGQLFQLASEAVLVVDGATDRVIDANPAAGRLCGIAPGRLVERGLMSLFEPDSRRKAETMLATVRAAGRADGTVLTLAEAGRTVMVAGSLFRQDNTAHYLVRLAPAANGTGADAPRRDTQALAVLASLPDGFVVTDTDRRILDVNAAFLDMAQLATREQALGEPIERWIGRPGVDVTVLMSNLKEHGALRDFSTIMRGEYGATETVDVTAVSAADAEHPCFGFVVRMAAARAADNINLDRALPRSVQQLSELVGRVALKDLVREATEAIERLAIEAALELTGDNRASAAQLLGLSRQSLYAKLRRYGLGDLDGMDEG